MAKQLVNPLERHVEKAVLGLTGLLLLGVVALYLISSPNKMEFGGEVVTPKAADAKVARKADDVIASIRNRQPPAEPPVPKPNFETRLTLASLPPAAPFHPMVPVVDDVVTSRGGAGLAEVVRLPAPQLTRGRTTIDLPSEWPRYAELGGKEVTDWVTVGAVFDVAEMSNRLAREYGGTRRKVIYAGVELQRRVQRSDGSWSDEDWQEVTPWPKARTPDLPPVPLREEDGKFSIRAAEHQAILGFVEQLELPALQLELIRPLMRRRINGDCWTFPIPAPLKERDVLMQDDEYLNPNQPPSANPANRYPCLTTETRVAAVTTATRLSGLEEQLRIARAGCMEESARQVYTAASHIEADPETGGADRARARTLVTQSKQLVDDIVAKVCRKSDAAAAGAGRRDPSPRQLVWAIDGAPGSLVPGETYQFRIRVVVYNPRTGEPAHFENPRDSTVVLLRGEWSPPTQPVTIPPLTQFFVTTANASRGSVSVEVFRWFGGWWVKPKSSSRIEKKIGEWIRTEARAQVEDPSKPGETAEPLVTFDAGRMIADIDFDWPIRERQRAGRGGVKFGPTRPTVAILLVNDQGELEERYEAVDKNHPDRSELLNIVYKPPRERP